MNFLKVGSDFIELESGGKKFFVGDRYFRLLRRAMSESARLCGGDFNIYEVSWDGRDYPVLKKI